MNSTQEDEEWRSIYTTKDTKQINVEKFQENKQVSNNKKGQKFKTEKNVKKKFQNYDREWYILFHDSQICGR